MVSSFLPPYRRVPAVVFLLLIAYSFSPSPISFSVRFFLLPVSFRSFHAFFLCFFSLLSVYLFYLFPVYPSLSNSCAVLLTNFLSLFNRLLFTALSPFPPPLLLSLWRHLFYRFFFFRLLISLQLKVTKRGKESKGDQIWWMLDTWPFDSFQNIYFLSGKAC